MRRYVLAAMLCLLVTCWAPAPVSAESLKLTWDPAAHPDIAGYLLHRGDVAGDYTEVLDIGMRTEWLLDSLELGALHYFAVQAYTADGTRGELSAPIAVTLPTGSAPGWCPESKLFDIIGHHQTSGLLQRMTFHGTVLVSTATLESERIDPAWRIRGNGDVDGDGESDLIWRHRSGGLGAWLMRGGARESARNLDVTVVDPAWELDAVGDLDGDGTSDFLWRHATGSVGFWLIDQLRRKHVDSFTPSRVSRGWRAVAIADFDGDGRPDILWHHENGALGVWLMEGFVKRQALSLTPNGVSAGWTVMGVRDVDGDGAVDILWRHEQGWLGAWLMNGTILREAVSLTPNRTSDTRWQLVALQ
jgi:hypothetical protein